MKERGRNFAIGLTSIVGIVGFAALLLFFGELDRLFTHRYEVLLVTDTAAGLRPGSHVELNGVPVGIIDAIQVRSDDPQHPVRLRALIEETVSIPSEVVLYSEMSLLGGSAILQLELPPFGDDPGAPLPQDDSATIQREIRYRMIEQLTAELDARMKPILSALDEFNRLSETYTALGRNLNELVAEEVEGTGRLTRSLDEFDAALADAREAIRLAGEWLGDEQLRADAHGAIGNFNALVEKASTAIDHYTRLADQLGGDAQRTADSMVEAADDLGAALESVRGLITLATEGEGTVGLLLKNPDLYRSLNDAALRLERTLVEIQLFFEKMKAEGIDINM